VSISSMAEKAVPISAAQVSIPSFNIRFKDIALEIGRPNCRSSISSTRALHLRDRPESVFSQRVTRQSAGMISAGAVDSHRRFTIAGSS
jgi:hypothetical protein